MRINTSKLRIPQQTSYDFVDGSLHSDPAALANYLAAQVQKSSRPNCYVRSYDKANRLQRLAEQARKDRSRHAR